MNEQLEQQLNGLAQAEQWQDIVDLIEAIPEEARDLDLIGRYVRALNNSEQAEWAIEVSLKYQALGENDALWHYRLGYAYWYLDRFAEALGYLRRGRELAAQDAETAGYIDELLIDIEAACNRQSLPSHYKAPQAGNNKKQ